MRPAWKRCAELAAFGFSFRVERRSKRVDTATESAFVKGGTRINFAYIGLPENLQQRIPALQQVRIKIEIDPPPLAEYEVLTLLAPIPFQVRLFTLPCLFAGKLHAIGTAPTAPATVRASRLRAGAQ